MFLIKSLMDIKCTFLLNVFLETSERKNGHTNILMKEMRLCFRLGKNPVFS